MVGLDVSLKRTSICVVNQAELIVKRSLVDSEPEAIAAFVRSKLPGTIRFGLETGPRQNGCGPSSNNLASR